MANRIRLLRKHFNLSQEELSVILNTTQQTIGNWERERSAPALQDLINLANYFGVSVDYLLYHDTQPTLDISTVVDPTAMPSDPEELAQFVRQIVDQALDERL